MEELGEVSSEGAAGERSGSPSAEEADAVISNRIDNDDGRQKDCMLAGRMTSATRIAQTRDKCMALFIMAKIAWNGQIVEPSACS